MFYVWTVWEYRFDGERIKETLRKCFFFKKPAERYVADLERKTEDLDERIHGYFFQKEKVEL